MSRLLVLFLGLITLSGCTVHEYAGHGYHRPYYHGEYREYRYDGYPARHYRYDRSDYPRHAPPPVVRHERYDQHRSHRHDQPSRHYSQGGDRHTRTPCATRFNTGATGRLSPSSITIAAASGSGPALPPTVSRGLTRL